MITSKGFNELKETMRYLDQMPFDVSRKTLYTAAELYEGFDPVNEETFSECFDSIVYQQYKTSGQHTSNVNELLARTLHDHRIHTALARFLKQHDPRCYVGVMGGHAMLRTDSLYHDIAHLGHRLTRQGFVMLTGGGPGAMEAAHLGAWMAGYSAAELDNALQMLEVAPSFRDKGWLSSAFKVIDKYPQDQFISLGIPTWVYGHEPSTPFATARTRYPLPSR